MAHLATQAESILKTLRPDKIYGASLLRVASGFDYVDHRTKVSDLAELFQSHDELMAVGVCDDDLSIRGIVTRVHLFTLLGKPFGREILSRRTVEEVAEEAARFDLHQNLFQTAESLQPTMDRSVLHYYLLEDSDGKFRGIFTSKDLLSYLSHITQEDILLAGQLQERLVKNRFSQKGLGWTIEALSQSAKGLGGDFYHVLPLPDGRLFVALGDVSGKGVAASVLTSLLWGVLQFYDYTKGLKKLLAQVNEALIRTFHLEKYLTGVFLLFDPRSREITMADMGHGHAWIVRAGKARALKFTNLEGNNGMNLPLGIDLELRPQVFQFTVQPGDMLCLYTDGLTEQENEAGEEMGEGVVLRTACHHDGDPRDLPEALLTRLARHQGKVPRLDDVTWLQLLIEDQPS